MESQCEFVSPGTSSSIKLECKDDSAEDDIESVESDSDESEIYEDTISASDDEERGESDPETQEELLTASGTRWKPLDRDEIDRPSNLYHAFNRETGPTAFAYSQVSVDSPLSAFRLFIDEAMFRNIRKCTEEEGMRRKKNFAVSLSDIEKFIGLILARGMYGGRTTPLSEFWTPRGVTIFPKTMTRIKFQKLMQLLRFDLKPESGDNFCLATALWEPFIQNCQRAYTPRPYLTVGEQFFPCRAKCNFIQTNRRGKLAEYGIKFWLLVDAETKYLCNGFPYFGKESKDKQEKLQTNVVLRLIEPYEGFGYNVTCDCYFTSLDLLQKLILRNVSLVGAMRQGYFVENMSLFSSKAWRHNNCGATITVYQYKVGKAVSVLSTLHPTYVVPAADNAKKKPESVLFYDKTKGGVDALDSMARLYSVRSGSRRWQVHVFYNILDLAVINAWIIYKEITKSHITRRKFMFSLIDELTGWNTSDPGANVDPEDPRTIVLQPRTILLQPTDSSVKRARCRVRSDCRNNATIVRCLYCNKFVCGKCRVKTIAVCRNCMPE